MYLSLEAISGITGSISIACWVVVFSPQIIENFRRSSAEGLSIVFVVTWLIGDVFNILGAVLQGVLPTMIILAVYYTLADIVLLGQCFYYRGFTLRDEVKKAQTTEIMPTERSALLDNAAHAGSPSASSEIQRIPFPEGRRRSSFREQLEHLAQIDGTHLSPATPLHNQRDTEAMRANSPAQKRSLTKAFFFNLAAILVVCAAGFLGWWLSTGSENPHHRRHHKSPPPPRNDSSLQFNILGQVFGYICAVLYLGSRIPQLLLNYRRKSTDGISMLFFLFACIGNLTYVFSVLAYEPVCWKPQRCEPGEASSIYWRYFLINLSWIIGSFGTLILDAGVFVQYFKYRQGKGEEVAVTD